MDKVRMILTAITIAINVLPFAGVLLVNQNDLLNLVIPHEITSIINNITTMQEHLGEALATATFSDSHYNTALRSVTVTCEITNPLPFDLAIYSMSAHTRCDSHDSSLGQTKISNPANISANETGQINLLGIWTQDALKHLDTKHAGQQRIDIDLIGISGNVNGIDIQTDEILEISDFPVK